MRSSPPRSIVGLILSAGQSRRMGKNKAVLPWRGTSVIRSLIAAYRRGGLSTTLVICRQDDHPLRDHIKDLQGVRIVVNPDADRGQLSSIQAGLRSVDPDVSAVLLGTVDQPGLDSLTVKQLLDEWRNTAAPLLIPTYDGQRGHPTIFSRALFADLLSADPEVGAVQVVDANEDQLAELAVEDAAVLQNLNTPHQYRQALTNS